LSVLNQIYLLDHILEGLGRLEGNTARGFDLDGFSGLRITAITSCALADAESSESYNLHRLVLLDASLDGIDHRIHRTLSTGFGIIETLLNGTNQFGLVHVYPFLRVYYC